MPAFTPGSIQLLPSSAAQLAQLLQNLQGPLGGLLANYAAMLQAQGSPPDLNAVNVSTLIGQAAALAQQVSSQMSSLQAQLASAQQALQAAQKVKTSFPPSGGQQVQQGATPSQGYSGGAVAGAGLGGAAAGFFAGLLIGKRK